MRHYCNLNILKTLVALFSAGFQGWKEMAKIFLDGFLDSKIGNGDRIIPSLILDL